MDERYLFRGKRVHVFEQNRKLDGLWVQGLLTHLDGDVAYISSVECGGEMLVDPATVGQCTGLKDQNRELIFEGDIVAVEFICSPTDKTLIKPVFFESGGFAIRGERTDLTLHDLVVGGFWRLTVVGNIHDDPELLESEKP